MNDRIRYCLTILNCDDSKYLISLGQTGLHHGESSLQPSRQYEFLNIACHSRQNHYNFMKNAAFSELLPMLVSWIHVRCPLQRCTCTAEGPRWAPLEVMNHIGVQPGDGPGCQGQMEGSKLRGLGPKIILREFRLLLEKRKYFARKGRRRFRTDRLVPCSRLVTRMRPWMLHEHSRYINRAPKSRSQALPLSTRSSTGPIV